MVRIAILEMLIYFKIITQMIHSTKIIRLILIAFSTVPNTKTRRTHKNNKIIKASRIFNVSKTFKSKFTTTALSLQANLMSDFLKMCLHKQQ